MAWVMLLAVRLDAGETRPTKAQYAAISLLCVISFVVNQAVGVASFAMLGLLAWRRSGLPVAIGAGALSLVLTALILTPWMLRNGETMGERLWLRSNFGLVLATRSEEHTSELQSLMRISYAVFCLKKKNITQHLTS